MVLSHTLICTYGMVCCDVMCAKSVKSLEKREQASLESSEQSIANINFSVSSDVQAIYDRIAFL